MRLPTHPVIIGHTTVSLRHPWLLCQPTAEESSEEDAEATLSLLLA